MLTTLAQLLPIAIAGAFLPTWTSDTILLLGTRRPLMTSSGFVLGNATYRFLLGFALLFVFSSSAIQSHVDSFTKPGPVVEIALGVVLITIGLIVRASRVSSDDDTLPRWIRSYERIPPWATFAWGFLSTASPGIQYLYLLAAVAVINRSGLPPAEQVVALIIWVAAVQVMLLTPIALFAWQRERAEATLGRVKRWIASTGATVFSWLLIGAGSAVIALAIYTGYVRR